MLQFGLIGGGVMGEALLSRLIELKIFKASEVIVSEPHLSRRSFLEQKHGVSTCEDNKQVMTSTKVVLLAIKPQVFNQISQQISDILPIENPPLVISILAGVSLSQLEAGFPNMAVVRAMPNAPATVGGGMTAMCMGTYTKQSDRQEAKNLLEAVGEVVEVPENLMDAVTGLSGSGPAYVALMLEALADGGVASGLPRAIANQLALQTILGTAQLLQHTKIHPAELKDRVTSPGGTTIAGVSELEKAGFRSALIEAVKAATRRSQELGK
jgi:pyrroline-5-carboxylate reductase